MGQNGISQGRIRQTCDGRYLHGGHNLSRADPESGKSENAIAVSLNHGLHKSSCFRKRARTQIGVHWDFEQAVWNALVFGFVLMETHVGQFRVGKQAIWNLPAGSYASPPAQICMDYAEIVDANVRELRAARHLPNRPHTGRSRLQALVDPDVSTVRQLNSGQI